MKKPFITVIIPTYNEENHIEALLTDLKNQTFKNFEVVIVDDYSKDRTVEIAKKFKTRIFFSGKHNLSISRNIGTTKSKGKVLVNLDADFRINKVFIESVAECFKHKDVEGVKAREKLAQETLIERLDYLRTFCKYDGYTQSVRIFRKGLLYDEELSCFGEDVSMIKKIKGRIVRCKRAVLTHHRFHTVKEIAKSWKLYPSIFTFIKKYEGNKNIWKGFIPLLFPLISPIIALQRLLTYKDIRALFIPFYDLVRTLAYIDGMLNFIM